MKEEPKKKKKKTQDSSDYWRQLGRLENLNKNSEVKVGVIFSYHSLIIGLFADKIDYFKLLFSENTIIFICFILWTMATVISVYFCFKCFVPIILKSKYEPNVFFFEDVVHRFGSIDDYVKKVLSVTEDNEKLYIQLAEQLHVKSSIVSFKFRNVKRAIFFFMWSIMFIIVTGVVMLIS
ncbi:MAG: hypothetical protein HKN00_00525 [Flavobacteriaceae bacterium]|nr:hypothetical protein [Bacteroidia bacterium]NNF73640.1 hypothetical protein [Flavobacteriaceae bacterium]NNK72340.1 hypothetical protein [Flavobacteriaceae bacterium]